MIMELNDWLKVAIFFGCCSMLVVLLGVILNFFMTKNNDK
jgi:putative Mn2+ efflux pump MntP